MEQERTKLLELAVSPRTELNKVRAALKVLTKENKQIEKSAEGLLDEKGAQEYLHVSRSTLWRLRKQGLCSIKLGERRLYRPRDLDRFVEKFLDLRG